jgi:hypothetical protein
VERGTDWDLGAAGNHSTAQLDVLLAATSAASIKKEWNMVPKTLDSFYYRVLLDIRGKVIIHLS